MIGCVYTPNLTLMLVTLTDEAMADGFTRFKMKVGNNLDDDRRRAGLLRQKIGEGGLLMVDANQRWEVDKAITWMLQLNDFNIYWIEEPTSPDDIEGHRKIAAALRPLGIKVATGEHCQNRVMFKQFMERKAMDVCQIDSCRVGGVNEILAILLVAAKLKVPVCPHAGGVGLCELVTHIAAVNYMLFSPSLEDVMVEYVDDDLHDHFEEKSVVENGTYKLPKEPGYARMRNSALTEFEYPGGSQWTQLFESGKMARPTEPQYS